MDQVVKSNNLAKAAEQLPVGIFEIAGVVKWFDVAKGYGFIRPDDGNHGDILLHVGCLKKYGLQTAFEGARIVCLVQLGERGLLAVQVLLMDESTAIVPPKSKDVRAVEPESGLERAIVKSFNPVKGFGFLTLGQGTKDIFIHMETLRRRNIIELEPGQAVLVRYGRNDKGLRAVEIYPDLGTISV